MFAASKTDSASTGGYQISRSLRFNSADSAYLDRAQTTGNTQIATWSGWVKRSALTIGAFSTLFSAGTSNTDSFTFSNTGDTLRFFLNGSLSADLVTTQVFRDPSSWYHIVVAIDTTQATAANRIKLYVNGVQVTSFATEIYPTQNYTFTSLNTSGKSANLGSIGTGSFLSAFMTEINFIDGQQLTPSSFGETNAQTGVWQPKAFSGGAYGTNGFYLNFSDNSNTTAATLGKDYSGNGNNWTPNNFSVSAGAGNDSMVDVPTPYGVDTGAGGTVRGNYCTLNPLATGSGKVLVNGNLDFTSSTSNWYFSLGTIGFSLGKYYWEMNCGVTNGSDLFAGIMGSGMPVNSVANGLQDNVSVLNTFGSLLFCDDGKYQLDGNTGRVAYSTALGSNQTLGIAVDMDAKSLTFYKDGVSQGAISFSSSPMASSFVSPSFSSYATTDSARVFNFGQRPFAYTAPSGFKALCTQNLPTPTIGATTTTLANSFFTTNLWAGNNGVQTVTNNIDTTNGGGLIWFKARNLTVNQFVVNSGSGYTKFLAANTVAPEDTFDFGFTPSTTGFSFNSGSGSVNQGGYTYVAWQWKANGTNVSNTSGTITSTVSANTTSGFSVVTYTGTGTTGATVGHGLGVPPSMIIAKARGATTSWPVYHSALGATNWLILNSTPAATTSAQEWNNTAPTSSVFTIGNSSSNSNQVATYVAYCFAPVAGYSAFGSYIGNGSASGPFVYTGFRPAFLLIRASSIVESWFLFDVARGTYNDNMPFIQANTNGIEYAFDTPEIMSNGFKLSTNNASVNGNGNTMIYAAFAETPFKYSLAR